MSYGVQRGSCPGMHGGSDTCASAVNAYSHRIFGGWYGFFGGGGGVV